MYEICIRISRIDIVKVAIVSDSYFPTRDGVVASIEILRNVFENRGDEMTVVAPDPGKDGRRDGVYYFPAIKFKSYAGYFVPVFPSNKRAIIDKINPDVVHIQGIAVMALKGVLAAHASNIPVIVTFHTMVSDTMKYYSPIKIPQDLAEKLVWKYLNYLMRWVDGVIAPSESTAKELRAHGINKEMRVIPTPVDTVRFNPGEDGSAVRKKYGLEGKRVIVCVGRVSFEKETDTLVRALKILDDETVLLIVGKGPASDSLRELAKELGISDRVILTGFVPDDELVSHYAAGDIAATASRFETQCLSAMEAMACGLPVACAKARAFEDYVFEGVNGFLFENSPEECAEAMGRAFAAGEDVVSNAIATASKYSEDSFYDNVKSFYEEIIERKNKGA
jgi:1,2-diacylglycerol 3-alpha-glucosyltransferase